MGTFDAIKAEEVKTQVYFLRFLKGLRVQPELILPL